jgi:hypothetical protein
VPLEPRLQFFLLCYFGDSVLLFAQAILDCHPPILHFWLLLGWLACNSMLNHHLLRWDLTISLPRLALNWITLICIPNTFCSMSEDGPWCALLHVHPHLQIHGDHLINHSCLPPGTPSAKCLPHTRHCAAYGGMIYK